MPTERITMPKYVIERELPNAGDLPQETLQAISQKSCAVLESLGPKIQWIQSYVTDNKIFCIYMAPSKELIIEHAQKGEFPANKVLQVRAIIDPSTAED